MHDSNTSPGQPSNKDEQHLEASGHADGQDSSHTQHGGGGSYVRFGLMILTAAVVMYLVMYLNTYSIDHVFWSWTRIFMTMMSTATMMAIMLAFMLRMYRNRAANTVIVIVAALLFGSGLYLVRSQATIGDVAWMRAMIPHHSIAILTSERAHLEDPRVQALADQIIKAQREEITEMKQYIEELND